MHTSLLFVRLRVSLLLLPAVILLFQGPGVVSVQAAEKRVHKIAVFAFATPFLKAYEGLRAGLAAQGYKLDSDLIFAVHSLERDTSGVTGLLRSALSADFDLIFSITTPVTQAVQASLLDLGATVPVVFTSVADPLGSRVVADLRHPGANFTGVSHISIELLPQRLLLFKKAFPQMQRVAVFFDPQEEISKRSFTQSYLRQAANDAGVTLMVNHVRSHEEMLAACRNFTVEQADALFMVPDALSVAHFTELLELSHRLRIPLMVIDNMLLQRGGVMGYSPGFYDVGFQAATIVEQIFHGVPAGEIAVQNPEKVKLVVSLKEAQALGLELSDEILLLADEVLR
ncbi:MAG: ABC transporter substrate-binding protein [Deltaproteobacteria bacterium]|nr:ABC transporter substrate-binding protein [Deltaproteobacteria bacterium]